MAAPESGSTDETAMQEAPIAAPAVACCERSDVASQLPCALCEKPTCRRCRHVVNGRNTCADCTRQLIAEVEAEQQAGARIVPALLGGLAAAVLCGAAWTLMVVITDLEIGYAAIGVGFATGYGVLLGARRRKGMPLQWIAVGCALLGLLLGKYFTLVHAIVTHAKPEDGLSWFDSRLPALFVAMLPQMLDPFDALWAVIALRGAWRIPAPMKVRIGRRKVDG